MTAQKPPVFTFIGFFFELLIKSLSWIMLSWVFTSLLFIALSAWLGIQATLNRIIQLKNVLPQPSLFVENKQLSLLNSIVRNLPDTETITSGVKNQIINHFISIVYPHVIGAIRLTSEITYLVVLKESQVILFLSMLFILYIVGIVDGLTKRHLRKLNGARESALLYHTLKKRILSVWFLGSLLYVVLPFYIPVDIFLLPLAFISAVILSVTVSHFKKYL